MRDAPAARTTPLRNRGQSPHNRHTSTQAEPAEAFVASQRAEGWIVLPDRYDDGGFSGASMDRPALVRLLLGLLVARVESDATAGTVAVTFHPTGIKALGRREPKEAA